MDILHDLQTDLTQVTDIPSLEAIERKYFGSKGLIKLALKGLGNLSIEERKAKGVELNQLQQEALSLIQEKKDKLSTSQTKASLAKDAESLSPTIPKIGHLHPLTQTTRMMNQIFIEMGYSVMEGPEIETDEYCLQRLNVPIDHPARDLQDMLYINEPNILLRSQTSSIEARVLEMYKPPMKIVIPGAVYRNEKVNRSNHFLFHQYQGIVVLEKVSLKDLFGTFTHLFRKMYGEDVVIRYRNKYYPEVEPGVGPDMQCFNCKGKGCNICKNVGWIEMGGSGIIHPKVLQMAGIDSNKWMGFAFGLGLDRWVMAKYHITDIRSLLGGNIAYKHNKNESII